MATWSEAAGSKERKGSKERAATKIGREGVQNEITGKRSSGEKTMIAARGDAARSAFHIPMGQEKEKDMQKKRKQNDAK